MICYYVINITNYRHKFEIVPIICWLCIAIIWLNDVLSVWSCSSIFIHKGFFPLFSSSNIIVKRHCIRMAETEPFGRFPVRAWFINRAALHSKWQRAIFAVRNEIMIRTYILWTGAFRKLFLSVLTQILWIWRMRKE